MSDRKRYVIVGTGGRSRMFTDAICERYRDHAQLVGFCDVSPTRMAFWNRHIAEKFEHTPVPAYTPERFDDLIGDTKAEVVIVTTVDAYHHEYIIRAMELGCDAVSEKPMTTDARKVAAILEAVERTGRGLRVTFNYRYMPAFSELRRLVMDGAIGEPTLVDFQWMLDTSHGADYFRRWHREMDKSGGLLVHKSSHHFDLVNFWLDDRPDTVFAHGDLRFYGKQNAARRGETYDYQRYTNESVAKDDPFALFLNVPTGRNEGRRAALQQLYLEAEADSGYVRDRNVFGDEPPVDIYDTMAVTARYRRGATLSYSLIAYCPWEGERVSITGTEGRVDYSARGKGHIIAGQSDEQLAEDQSYTGEKYLRLQRMFEPARELEIPKGEGGHGGGDRLILDRVFLPPEGQEPDPLHRDATHLDGAASVLLGAAANRSIQTGQAVRVDDLVTLPT